MRAHVVAACDGVGAADEVSLRAVLGLVVPRFDVVSFASVFVSRDVMLFCCEAKHRIAVPLTDV
jgi:hypothetical protein